MAGIAQNGQNALLSLWSLKIGKMREKGKRGKKIIMCKSKENHTNIIVIRNAYFYSHNHSVSVSYGYANMYTHVCKHTPTCKQIYTNADTHANVHVIYFSSQIELLNIMLEST